MEYFDNPFADSEDEGVQETTPTIRRPSRRQPVQKKTRKKKQPRKRVQRNYPLRNRHPTPTAPVQDDPPQPKAPRPPAPEPVPRESLLLVADQVEGGDGPNGNPYQEDVRYDREDYKGHIIDLDSSNKEEVDTMAVQRANKTQELVDDVRKILRRHLESALGYVWGFIHEVSAATGIPSKELYANNGSLKMNQYFEQLNFVDEQREIKKEQRKKIKKERVDEQQERINREPREDDSESESLPGDYEERSDEVENAEVVPEPDEGSPEDGPLENGPMEAGPLDGVPPFVRTAAHINQAINEELHIHGPVWGYPLTAIVCKDVLTRHNKRGKRSLRKVPSAPTDTARFLEHLENIGTVVVDYVKDGSDNLVVNRRGNPQPQNAPMNNQNEQDEPAAVGMDRMGNVIGSKLFALLQLPVNSDMIIFSDELYGWMKHAVQNIREASGINNLYWKHLVIDPAVRVKFALLVGVYAQEVSGASAYRGAIINGGQRFFLSANKSRRNEKRNVSMAHLNWFKYIALVETEGSRQRREKARRYIQKHPERGRQVPPPMYYAVHTGMPTSRTNWKPPRLNYG